MEFKKHLSGLALAALLLAQVNLGVIPAFEPLIQETSAAGGDFRIEGADPKYGKTWIATITCRTANGGTQTYGNGDSATLRAQVAAAITSKHLPLTLPSVDSLVGTDNASGGGNLWNMGTPHIPTLDAVCKILGSSTDTYLSQTCLDNERSARYPNGKCNYHSPGDNHLWRFVGTFTVPQCQDGIDNDGDGTVDGQDFSCSGPGDDDETNPKAQCQDGQDNDGDGAIDSQDFSCSGPGDNDEANPKAQCQDGQDNDGDGKTDAADPRCHTDNNASNPNSYNKQDNDEGPQDFQCNDGIDNDGDGAIDSQDFSCSGPGDNDEANPKAQCQDGIDNDGDGKTDAADPRCHTDNNASNPNSYNKQDNDESPDDRTQCSDGTDNDGDGAIDAADASCHSDLNPANAGSYQPTKNDELNPKTQCQDGIDNDGDGLTDTQDPGCANPQDNSEKNPNGPHCDNGIDDDNDGKVDFPQDLGCFGPTDTSELNMQCSDGQDNDGDGAIDAADASCHSDLNPANQASYQPGDNDESLPKTQCQDGIDNDGDGLKDLQDPGCTDPQDNTENSEPAPNVDIMINGSNGPITVLAGTTLNIAWSSTGVQRCNTGTSNMPGWTQNQNLPVNGNAQFTATISGTYGIQCSKTQTSNFVVQDAVAVIVTPAQCSDGTDNDGDGAIDAADASCHSDLNPANAASYQPTKNDESQPKTQCQDGVDNDGDGLSDLQDPGCSGKQDNSEKNPNGPQCDNGIDDDNDGRVDFPQDTGCTGPTDTSELNMQCSDGQDNDGDGAIDAADASCHTDLNPANAASYQPNDNDESLPKTACQDGIDNDGDGLTDTQDPGCANPQDNSEKNPNGPQCDNGIDDDGDTKVDFPQDTGCSGPTDPTERNPQCSDGIDNDTDGVDDADDASCHTDLNVGNGASYDPNHNDELNPKTQCQDGIDNDGDGLVDLQDPGCSGKQDNSEKNPNGPQCDNGIDDDGDGKVDFPQDPDCSSPTDTNETSDPADLKLTVSGPSTATKGQTVSYPFVITNNGPGIAQGVNLSIPVPAGLSYDAVNSEQTCQPGPNNTVQCYLGQLALNPPQRSLTVRFIVTANAQCGSQPVILGTVTSTTTDPNLSNNTASPALTITCTQCNDGLDNDNDGAIDLADFSCGGNAGNNNETTPKAQCQDGIDNDGDTFIDSQDPACSGNQDNDESPVNTPTVTLSNVNVNGCNVTVNYTKQFQTCAHLVTTQGSQILHSQNLFCNQTGPVTTQLSNFFVPPFAPGLSVKLCNGNNSAECSQSVTISGGGACNPTTQCSDGQDNDGDGAIDAADASCHSDLNPANAGSYQPTKNDELNPKTQCQDGIDNDGDGLTDTQDPGCANPQDNSEKNPNGPQCDNGIDDDGDTKVDFPQDPGCSSPTDTSETDPVNQADLFVVKSGPNQITRGNVIAYTVTAYNLGPNTAQGVTINDPIPAGLTFNAGLSDPSCVQNGNNILCNNTTLAINQNKTVAIAFNVPTIPNCTQSSLQNIATVSSSTTDPNSANNQSQAVITTVLCPTVSICSDGLDNDHDGQIDLQDPGCSDANDQNEGDGQTDLQISMTGPATVDGNQNATYTVTVRNNGPDAATTPFSFRDPIPAGVTFVPGSSSPNCAVSGSDVVCSGITLGVGQQATYTVTFNAPVPVASTPSFLQRLFGIESVLAASCGASFQNQVFVTPSQPDPNSGNNQSSVVTTTVTCQQPPQFTLTKVTSNEIQANEILTYIITATNVGATAQTGIRIADLVPAGLTYTTNGSTAGCVQQGTTVYCQPQTFQPGQSVSYTLKFTANANNPCDMDIVNTAAIQQNSITFAQSNQTHTHYYCTTPKLDINKSAPPLSNAGGTVTYTYTLKNTSTTQTAQDVHVEDFNIDPQANHIPSQFTFVSSSLGGACAYNATNDYVSCNIGNLAPNQLITFTLTFSIPNNPQLCDKTVINQVDAWPGSDIANADWDKAQTYVQCAPQNTDVSVVKTGPATLNNDGTVSVSYKLVIANTTANAAQNVVVSDNVPAGLTITSATAPCVIAGNAVTCNLGTMAGNATKNLWIYATAPAAAYCGQTIANTGTVTTSTTDTNPQNNTSTAQTSFTCTPQNTDVSIVKSAPATLPNDNVTPYSYSLTVTNNTSVPAQNVVVTDTIPSGLSITSTTAPCTAAGNAVTCNLGTLAANATVILSIGVSAPSRAYCAQTVANTATVATSTTDSNLQNNTSTAQTAFTCTQQNAKLYITKDVAATTVAGQNVTYYYTLQNTSTFTANGINVYDYYIDSGLNQIPLPFTFVSSTGITCHTDQANNRVACDPVNLTAGQMISFTMTFQTPSTQQVCNQAFTNRAESIVGTNQQTLDTDTAATVLTCPTPQFTIVKYADLQTIHPGDTITYTIVATNAGTQSQQNVRIADNVPANMTFVPTGSTTGCAQQGTAIFCPAQTFTAGQTTTTTLKFQLAGNAPCGNNVTVDNVADVQQNAVSIVSSNHVTTPVACVSAPQFTLTKIGPTVVSPGELMTYIITATNVGTTAQSGIAVYDDVPAGTTYEPNGSTAGCTLLNGNHVYCAQQTYQPGQSATFTLKFRANQNVACTAVILNKAELAQNGADFLYSNEVQTPVTCASPKLDITKSAPAISQAGGTVTYTFTLRNTNATVTALDVNTYDFFIDATANHIPSPFTFLSSSLGGGACVYDSVMDRTVCHIGDMAPNQVITFTMTYSIPNTQQICNQTVINQVDAWPGADDLNADWDKAQTLVQCAPQGADLSILKSGPTSVTKGGTVVYTLTVNNLGPATATNVVTHDQIPQGMTFVSASGPANCVLANNNTEVACTIGSVTAGTPVVLQLTFATPAAAPSCVASTATNVATVTASTTDPVMTNNQSQVVTQLTCPLPTTADLAIVKTGPASVIRGNSISYSIVVSNSGPASATGVTVTDLLPAGLQNIQVSGGTCAVTGNGSQASCSFPSIAAGSSVTVTVTATVPTIQNCTQTAITNTANVTSTTTDPNTGNNQSVVVTTLTCPTDTNADVGIIKFGQTSVVRGNNVTYSIIATNYGPGTAQNLTITDPLPQGFTFVSASGVPCTNQNGNLTCTIASLASGQSTPVITATYNVPTIQNCSQTTVTNTATVATTSTDPNAGNNSAQVQTAVTCQAPGQADLFVNKTGPQSVQYGSNVVYTVTATNAGPASASGVTVTDTIPLGLTYVSVSGATCVLALPSGNNPTFSGMLSCDVGTLASGGSKSFTLTFSTTAPQTCTAATVTNLVNVSENDPNVTDPNSTNNQSQATTNLTCASVNADVAISKTGPTSVQRGSTLTYTLTATNNGPSSASNVIIKDPYNTTELTYSSSSGATCSVVGSEVQCTVGTMASGQTVTVSLVFNVKTVSGTCSQTSIQNTATITTGSTDPVSSNNTSQTITTTLTCSGGSVNDISVYKTDNRSTANVGESLRYSIILTNTSSQVVNSLLVTDPVPYGLTILTVSDGGTISGQQVRWTDISVPANSSRTLYIDVQVSSNTSNNTVLRNTVDVNGKQSTDETTVYNNNNNNPPYYPPYTPPPYYPPVYNPPTTPYYPPVYNPPTTVTPPPVYYPTQPIYPVTGTRDGQLYAPTADTASLTKVQAPGTADDNGFSAVFYATMLAIFAAGSAVASRFLAGGL